MAYEEYLPYIDVNEGVARLMNNMKIYINVLKKFNGTPLLEDIMAAASAQDFEKLQYAAHTLKGSAGNLSLKRLYELSFSIETCAKESKDPGELISELQDAVSATAAAAEKLIAEI